MRLETPLFVLVDLFQTLDLVEEVEQRLALKGKYPVITPLGGTCLLIRQDGGLDLLLSCRSVCIGESWPDFVDHGLPDLSPPFVEAGFTAEWIGAAAHWQFPLKRRACGVLHRSQALNAEESNWAVRVGAHDDGGVAPITQLYFDFAVGANLL